ncbi:ferredoxin [Cupriavidus oxalaticus]|uniref:Ferredoxin n=1 Tax=Cupriavidus oxalaticus TaxID=96344 RepID=A0A4V1BY10_9BURK|nr:ferredoxin [Cupriavidus oxalaticus]QBY50192.1 ferredoxin [Cupriavidus oxalaticus]
MFVLLTSRPGQFRTEPTDGMTAVEAYDYVFYGKRTARFVIAELAADTAESKVRVQEETPPGIVNLISTKFLDKYATLEAARAALRELASFGSMDIALVPTPVAVGGQS